MLKKLIRQMVITQTVSELIVNVCLMIDAIMIGQFLGIESLSAYGYSAPIILIFTAISGMICTGSQVLSGRTVAVGDKKGTDSCFSSSITFSLLVSIIGSLIVLLFANQIIPLLGAGANTPSNTVFHLTKDYLFGFLIGTPAFMIMKLMVPYLQMAGERKQILITTVLASVTDIILNLLNVFVFKLGIFGMGLASALSYYIASIFAITLFVKKVKIFNFNLSLVNKNTIFQIIKNGLSLLILHLCLVTLPLLRNHLLTSYGGSIAVAAYSTVSSIGNLGYAPIFACMTIIISLSSMFFAEKDKNSIRKSLKIVLEYLTIMYVVIIFVLLVAAKPIVLLFTDNLEAIDLAAVGLRWFALSLLPCGISATMGHYYQGTGRSKLAIAITVLQNFGFAAVCSILFATLFGSIGIWIGIVATEIATMAFVILNAFIRNKKISFSLDNFLLLPKDFGVKEKDCLQKSITNQKEVIDASKEAEEFCKKHGLDKKKSYHIGLAIEELGNNIIEYGFIDGKKHVIDIRIVINKESTILCIKDNCSKFDPVKYMELHQDDDPFAHLGIRMIMKIVKDANYSNSFGLNNLLLEL